MPNRYTAFPESEAPPAPRLEKRARRQFSSEYTLKLLAERDNTAQHCGLGTLLRRERRYRSQLQQSRREQKPERVAGLIKTALRRGTRKISEQRRGAWGGAVCNPRHWNQWRKIYRVLAGHSIYSALKVREQIDTLGGNITLLLLPASSTERGTGKQGWKQARPDNTCQAYGRAATSDELRCRHHVCSSRCARRSTTLLSGICLLRHHMGLDGFQVPSKGLITTDQESANGAHRSSSPSTPTALGDSEPRMNMSKPSVSVIIPCFNSASDILPTLRSLAEQSTPPDEIIVVDDGSIDDSATLAQAFDPSIRVIRQENAGAAAARFHGVQTATKDVVIFNDAGDLSYSSRIESLSRALCEHPHCVAAFAKTWVKPRDKPVWCRRTGTPFDGSVHVLPDTLEQYLAQSWPLAIGMNFAVRREIALLSANVPRFYRAANDYALQIFTACHGPFAYISKITLEYSPSQGGISHNVGWMQQQAYALCAAGECYERVHERQPDLNDIFIRRVDEGWPAAALHAYLRMNPELRRRVIRLGLKYGHTHKVPKRLWWALMSAYEYGHLEHAKVLRQGTKWLRLGSQLFGLNESLQRKDR